MDDVVDAPWNKSWFWWRRGTGDGWVLFWVAWIHAWAAVGLVLFPLPGWRVLAIAYGFAWIGGLGTTIAYHRTLAHKALTLHPAVEFVLTAFAIFNSSGTPATWTANHRWHHARVETPEDISSPRIGGFWWSHLRWLWQAGQTPVDRWAPDLRSPYYTFWTAWQIRILSFAFLAGLPLVPFLGWGAFFWCGAIRLVFSLNAQCFVNSVAHMKPGVAAGEDSSQNLVWLGIPQSFQGENWHGNHHANPSSARLGWTWKQIDIGWYVIVALEKLGLAHNVRRPREVELRAPDRGRTLNI